MRLPKPALGLLVAISALSLSCLQTMSPPASEDLTADGQAEAAGEELGVVGEDIVSVDESDPVTTGDVWVDPGAADGELVKPPELQGDIASDPVLAPEATTELIPEVVPDPAPADGEAVGPPADLPPDGGENACGACQDTLGCVTWLLRKDFDDNSLQGFTVSPLYPDAGGPVWLVDTLHASSPPAALYFGDPSTHSYDNGTKPAGGRAESPEADLAQGVDPELRFRLWKETEVVASSDTLTVLVVSGGKDATVWTTAQHPEFSNTGGLFADVAISLLAFAGQKVKVAFVLDTVPQFANAYPGVWVDDVEVVSKCP